MAFLDWWFLLGNSPKFLMFQVSWHTNAKRQVPNFTYQNRSHPSHNPRSNAEVTPRVAGRSWHVCIHELADVVEPHICQCEQNIQVWTCFIWLFFESVWTRKRPEIPRKVVNVPVFVSQRGPDSLWLYAGFLSRLAFYEPPEITKNTHRALLFHKDLRVTTYLKGNFPLSMIPAENGSQSQRHPSHSQLQHLPIFPSKLGKKWFPCTFAVQQFWCVLQQLESAGKGKIRWLATWCASSKRFHLV